MSNTSPTGTPHFILQSRAGDELFFAYLPDLVDYLESLDLYDKLAEQLSGLLEKHGFYIALSDECNYCQSRLSVRQMLQRRAIGARNISE